MSTISLDDLKTVPQLAAAYPHLLTVSVLRYALRHRDSNGLAKACVHVGGKLAISKTRFEAWLTERAGSNTPIGRVA